MIIGIVVLVLMIILSACVVDLIIKIKKPHIGDMYYDTSTAKLFEERKKMMIVAIDGEYVLLKNVKTEETKKVRIGSWDWQDYTKMRK